MPFTLLQVNLLPGRRLKANASSMHQQFSKLSSIEQCNPSLPFLSIIFLHVISRVVLLGGTPSLNLCLVEQSHNWYYIRCIRFNYVLLMNKHYSTTIQGIGNSKRNPLACKALDSTNIDFGQLNIYVL